MQEAFQKKVSLTQKVAFQLFRVKMQKHGTLIYSSFPNKMLPK